MPLQPGQVLHNRYQIQSQLGQGGMGAVYLARDLSLEHKVAVKEMRPAPDINPTMLDGLRQQFMREARVLAGLAHPNLPRVIDYFSEGGNEYLVMDYVEGQTLSDVLKAQGRPGLPEAQVLSWAHQLLDALEYIHNKNVLHRDIKPANIRLTPEGRAVLVDFGLVKLYDPHSPQTVMVLRGAGTPQYAPPEQIDSTFGHTDARSDIFSLGATLYYLLTGKLPPSITERLIKQTPIQPIWSQAAGVSSATEAAILKALQLRPQDRFQSAAEMRAALPTPGGAPTVQPAPRQAPSPPLMPPGRQTIQPTQRSAIAQAMPAPKRGGIPTWAWLGGAGCLLALLGCGLLMVVLALAPSSPAPTSTPRRAALPPAPTDTPAPVVLYSDDFSDSSSGWEERKGTNTVVGYSNGKYFVEVNREQYVAWETAGQSFSDVVIEVDVEVVAGDEDTEYGIVCRYQDSDNFYILQAVADGSVAIRIMQDGQLSLISGDKWDKSAVVNRGLARNKLKAICDGSRLALYVNDRWAVEATDSSWSSGDVGLLAGTFGAAGVRVEFDNFRVTQP